MSSFQTDISTLGITSSFEDWFNQYRIDVVSKLNNVKLSRPFAGDGITLTSSSSGGYTFSLSGSVSSGMTFLGNVDFQGSVSLGNAQLGGLVIGITGNFIDVGVTLGKVVRVVSGGGITLANANSPSNSEVLGIAIDVNASRTIVAVAGKISGNTLSNNLISGGFTSGCVYFLDPVINGGITRTEPSTVGHVSKPVVLGISTNEGLILPFRGQHITGLCGASGENLFNTAIYVSVVSKAETESNFDLRPGKIIATNAASSGSNSEYSGAFSNVYFKATKFTPAEKILGIVSEYVGGYNATNGGNIILKVNTNGSVLTSVSSLPNWTQYDSGEIYLNESGLPTTVPTPIFVGNVADNELVLNIRSPSQLITSNSSGAGAGVGNILINGGLHFWQRGRGVTLPFGITAGLTGNKQYLADKWIMWGVSGENGYTGERKAFSLNQTEVAGYPKYYVSLRKNTNVASDPAYFYNVIDDVRKIADKQFTLSLYARTPGETGSFSIHSIQNISVDGNTYVNGTTHSTFITSNTNWSRYTTTFVGPSAGSGIEDSYSLLGIRFNENGKTFEFAQFILEEGATASTPRMIDIKEEYLRIAPYYQRSYGYDEITGSDTLSVNEGIRSITSFTKEIRHKLDIPLQKIPLVEIYSLNGVKNCISVLITGVYLDLYDDRIDAVPGYECARVSAPIQIPSIVSNINRLKGSFNFTPVWTQATCLLDEVAFHYIADADTTIN